MATLSAFAAKTFRYILKSENTFVPSICAPFVPLLSVVHICREDKLCWYRLFSLAQSLPQATIYFVKYILSECPLVPIQIFS